MTHIFAVPELARRTASYLPSSDIAHLTECNRLLHGSLLSTLYCHVEFSVYKATLLRWTLQKKPSLAKHARSLSITMTSNPPDDEKIAYRSDDSDKKAKKQARAIIRKKVIEIIREFSKSGKLSSFSWDRERRMLGHNWILDLKKFWPSLLRCAKTLRCLDCSFSLTSRESTPSIPPQNLIPGKTFEALSLLSLHVELETSNDLKDMARIVLRFPTVKVMSFSFWSAVDEISLERQALCINVGGSDGKSILKELTVSGSSALEYLGPYKALKGLNVARFDYNKIPDQLFCKQLQQLIILRIPDDDDDDLHISLKELPNLACLEITTYDEISNRIASFMLPNLLEFAVIVRVASRRHETIKSCTDIERLLNLVQICAANCKLLRAIRLVYKSDDWSGGKEKTADLPDQIALSLLHVPSALEYIMWEVPWMLPKLFRAQRTDSAVDAVYTGRCRLSDRPSSKHGSWTDESVFDYMGLTGEGS